MDINKGDDLNPNYRSRLVARELKALDKSGASYFAPAPPLEALRTVISTATTRIGRHQPVWDPLARDRQQISFIDVQRDYFNAKLGVEAKSVRTTPVCVPSWSGTCTAHDAPQTARRRSTRPCS